MQANDNAVVVGWSIKKEERDRGRDFFFLGYAPLMYMNELFSGDPPWRKNRSSLRIGSICSAVNEILTPIVRTGSCIMSLVSLGNKTRRTRDWPPSHATNSVPVHDAPSSKMALTVPLSLVVNSWRDFPHLRNNGVSRQF